MQKKSLSDSPTPDQLHQMNEQVVHLKKKIKLLETDLENSKMNEEKLRGSLDQINAERKGDTYFFSNLTHELRTPLHAVISFTNLLMMGNLDEKQTEYINSLKFSADNLLMLINNILDLHKLDESKVEVEHSEFDLVNLLTEIKKMLQNKVDEKGKDVKLLLELDPKIPNLLVGDLMRVSQVLNNLINNAIKFTHKGYIKIKVEVAYLVSEEIMLHHEIEDTGIGIAKDRQAKIFEAFEQAEVSTTREFGGTGLGLAITKKLLEALGSKIELESEEGVGSKFSFCMKYSIPKTPPAEEKPNATSSNETIEVDPDHFKGFVILVVEDNPINQMIAESFMENWHIDHKIVGDGQQGLEEIQENDYDLVLMDLQMPILNGFDATREIRKLGGKFSKIPIVALSASTLGEEVEESIKAGMNKFLTKPFKTEEFFRIIEDYYLLKTKKETTAMRD